MNSSQNDLFRKESLERLSSPERLDQLMQIVTPRTWLGFLALGGITAVGVLWGIYGSIPITVTASGAILTPSQVVELQSPLAGQIQTLKIQVGDCLKKAINPRTATPNAIVATIDPSDLRQQRQQQQIKLAKLQSDNQATATLENQRLQIERNNLQLARAQLQQRLRDANSLNPELKTRSTQATAQQRQSLRQRMKDIQALEPILAERLKGRQLLLQAGAITQDIVLQAEQEYRQNQQTLAELQAQMKSLDVNDIQTEQQYLNTFTSTAEIEAQLRNLDSQIKQLQQQTFEGQTVRQNTLLDVQQQIQQLDRKIQDSSKITSPYNGCVLELTAAPGQVVSPGSPLAKLQVDQPHQALEAIAYFPVGDGKRIRPGMVAQVVPSSIKREQFGGIVGTVTAVSALPRSSEGIAQVVGNRQLAEQLTAKGPPIEVRIRLKSAPGTSTGYAWTSSRGPQTLAITSGMTTSTWITLERQAPITFVLPILRQQLGLD